MGETVPAGYRAEHAHKVEARFTPAKRRARSMARYVAERIESLPADSLERQKLTTLEKELRLCRNHLLFRDHPADKRITLSRMKSCKRTRLCPLCGVARANGHVVTYRQKIAQLVRQATTDGIQLRAYFVTLTKLHGVALAKTYGEFTQSVTRLVSRRRDAEKARAGSIPHAYALGSVMASVTAGVFSFEVKRGKGSGLWNVHTHGLLLTTEPIEEYRLSAEWKVITGDSFIVDVQEVGTDDVKALCEVLKYSLKFSEMTLADNYEAATTLAGKRLIRSFGDFYGLKPDDTADIDDTTVLDSPYIERLYRYTGGAYQLTTTSAPIGGTLERPQLSRYSVDRSGCIVTVPTTETLAQSIPEPIRATADDADSPITDHQSSHEGNDMLRAGRFSIEGSTFTVEGQDYLLRERDHPTKSKPQYYLISLPGGEYVSSLWPKGDSVFSVDFMTANGTEKVFGIDFTEPGFVRITDCGFTRRSIRSAPWRKGPRRKGRHE